jgi:hypothetical protein
MQDALPQRQGTSTVLCLDRYEFGDYRSYNLTAAHLGLFLSSLGRTVSCSDFWFWRRWIPMSDFKQSTKSSSVSNDHTPDHFLDIMFASG